ncbi:GNAT family N-acetyltransferase [Pseudactinotalea suaedae]|uniref:GNAT family N-acetyltransferase n=1 Tax=Pseudactinotalea suaedae TaxID=1524924 RepID=UPI0012E2D6C4|nr:GNAT family N-acetyltransferase [Pseudactinotalea suaedae]
MRIELRPLTESDVQAHNDGEDAETVRWLTGAPGTPDSTARHIAMLAENAVRGQGQQGFGVWLEDRLAGYVDYNPAVDDGLEPGEVNITYATHPWARGRGVAVAAVQLLCDRMAEHAEGSHAAIRVDPENHASVRVAEKAGFTLAREVESTTDVRPDGTLATLLVWLRDLAEV